jgi:hypothetical protein
MDGFSTRRLQQQGFWAMAHEARTDCSMLLGSVFRHVHFTEAHMAGPRHIVPLHLPGAVVAAPSGNLTYHGGAVLHAVEVVPIYWGAAWATGTDVQVAAQVDAFFDFILTSQFMDLLAEYNTPATTIGRGSRVTSVGVSGSEPGTVGGGVRQVTDAQVRQALQGWVAAGTIPPVTDNTLYFVYLPRDVVSIDGGTQSCQDYCGYHDHINKRLFYAVEPYITCVGCDFGGILDSLTKVSSHELAEAVTDPALDAWWDSTTGDEIGDICNASTARLGGFLIQPQWSNAQAACVVAPPGAATRGATPVASSGRP